MAVVVGLLAWLTVAAGATPARAAVAGIDPTAASDAFRAGQHVYVYPGGSTLVGPSDAADIAASLKGSKVYLAVLPATTAVSFGDADALATGLVAAAGSKNTYVLQGWAGGSAGHFLKVASPVSYQVWRPQLVAALKAGAPASEARSLTAALKKDTQPGFPWGTVIGIAVVVLLVLLVLWLVLSRRRGAAARRRSRRDDVQAQVQALQDDLLAADPAGRVALQGGAGSAEQRALQTAWNRQQAAEEMLARAGDDATVDRASRLVGQGRAALEQAMRLRDGVPSEADVRAMAAGRPGPSPAERHDAPQGPPPRQQRFLPQYTAASYPGYGYGWYPGWGYGYFDYGGSFITGMLAGELLADAFDPWGGAYGFGGYDAGYGTGYDAGYGSGYEQGYDQGAGADPSFGDGGSNGNDPSYGTDDSGAAGDPSYGTDGGYDPSYGTDSGGYDSGGYDSGGGFDSGGFDSGGGSDSGSW